MTIYLRQSTASQEVLLPRMVDSTDGNTAETGLTIANTDIKIWKAGATTQANKNSGGATHISSGDYYAVLDATDTDTVGSLVITCHPTGALYTRVECMVLPANVYDAWTGSDLLDVSMTQILGTAVATPTTAGVLEVDLTHIAGAAVSTSTAQLGVNMVSGSTGAITAGVIAADAIGASELAADAVTEIQSGLATAANLATVAGYLDTEIAAILAAVDTEIAALPTAAGIADAVWDEALSGHVTAGTAGRALRMEAGTAQWATSTTIVLQADESATDDIHNGSAIVLIGGTGVGQAREITDYTGSSKTATVATWTTTPDSTTKYVILGN